MFGRLLTNPRERRADSIYDLSDTDPRLYDILVNRGDGTGSGESWSGESVNTRIAMGIAAYYAGVNIIADAFASLPFGLFDARDDGSREPVQQHRAAWLLGRQPNPEMSPVRFKRLVPTWIINWGNFFAEIERERGSGMPLALWPIHPSRVSVERKDRRGQLRYMVSNDGGSSSSIEPANILHDFADSDDGIVGIAVLTRARQSLGLTIAAEKSAAKFFGKGGIPKGIIMPADDLDEEGMKVLRSSWKSANKDENIAIWPLGKGTYQQMSLSMEDSQFLQTRQNQDVEIGRWLKISPYKIFDYRDGLKYNTVEHLGIDFATTTIRPYALSFEEECERKLLTPAERGMVS